MAIRQANARLTYTCIVIIGPNWSCFSPETTATAPCKAGERATAGGHGQPGDGVTVFIAESKPAPQAGTPTGWQVTVGSASTTSTGPSRPDSLVPIYVVCAAP